jgi:hypothetical protein
MFSYYVGDVLRKVAFIHYNDITIPEILYPIIENMPTGIIIILPKLMKYSSEIWQQFQKLLSETIMF